MQSRRNRKSAYESVVDWFMDSIIAQAVVLVAIIAMEVYAFVSAFHAGS
jgi:hypothetical protein